MVPPSNACTVDCFVMLSSDYGSRFEILFDNFSPNLAVVVAIVNVYYYFYYS